LKNSKNKEDYRFKKEKDKFIKILRKNNLDPHRINNKNKKANLVLHHPLIKIKR
jgi:hypothetical protein